MRNPDRRISVFLTIIVSLLVWPGLISAAPLTFRHYHHLYALDPARHPEWRKAAEMWIYRGRPIVPPSHFLVDGDDVPRLPEGFERRIEEGWNVQAIRGSLARLVAADLRLERGKVTIRRTATGHIVFDGLGMPGRELDLDAAASLTARALSQGITDIVLPVTITQPEVIVEDEELRALGIREIVALGESDFSNSPPARRHNIAVGLSKFNGHLIPKGSTFSFNRALGRVDAGTGYWKELVIKGDRTIPDYGGGLCQVSSTAYRGVWEAGFPIVRRVNHSFTVNHYSPQGTDATVYPPDVDMRFVNNSPGALLVQTHAIGDLAYFLYYGTRDDRESEIIGPYIWDKKAPPPDREEPTIELPPGTRKKIGDRIPGMKALWYRIVRMPGEQERIDSVFSAYEARPLFHQIGVQSLPAESGDNPTFEEVNQREAPRAF